MDAELLRRHLAGEQPEFSLKAENVCGLSGLSWYEGDRFYAVSDRAQALLPLRITLNAKTGGITAIKLEPPVMVKPALSDWEDLACDAAGGRVFVSTEQPPGLAAFSVAGKPLRAPVLPEVFRAARPNLSMESLTRDAASGRMWTANEDTLPADGDVSSDKAGGLVRLQEFGANGKPRRQFAWRTETSSLRIRGSGTGVSALCLLPDGSLLVMERVVAGITLEVRLFLAGFTGATDTSNLASLAGTAFVPAQKRLLYKRGCGFTNYEGLTAGPALQDGSRSLLLVADSGEGSVHQFLALRLAGGHQ